MGIMERGLVPCRMGIYGIYVSNSVLQKGTLNCYYPFILIITLWTSMSFFHFFFQKKKSKKERKEDEACIYKIIKTLNPFRLKVITIIWLANIKDNSSLHSNPLATRAIVESSALTPPPWVWAPERLFPFLCALLMQVLFFFLWVQVQSHLASRAIIGHPTLSPPPRVSSPERLFPFLMHVLFFIVRASAKPPLLVSKKKRSEKRRKIKGKHLIPLLLLVKQPRPHEVGVLH